VKSLETIIKAYYHSCGSLMETNPRKTVLFCLGCGSTFLIDDVGIQLVPLTKRDIHNMLNNYEEE